MLTIALNADSINTLDLSAAQTVVDSLLLRKSVSTHEQQLQFNIAYPQAPDDPRELPHQFHPKEGIQYNPEALEIFVMHKTFVLAHWMQQQGIEGKARLKAMTQMLGYEIDDAFFELL